MATVNGTGATSRGRSSSIFATRSMSGSIRDGCLTSSSRTACRDSKTSEIYCRRDRIPPRERQLPSVRMLDPSLSWEDIRWLRDYWPRTLIIKGISTVEDALLAAEYGADGIVLSNHGGRQLDGAVSAMEVLPEVAAAAGGKLTVLIDGGFRRGSDIVKARLLGADAVLLGRATLYGLAAGGEAGAAHAISILRSEVDRVLGLLGYPDLTKMNPGCVRWRNAARLFPTNHAPD